MIENEKFDFSLFSSFKSDGQTRKIEELEEYMKTIDKENITFKEKLKKGDKVKLKGLDYIVVIQYIEYEIQGLGKVDYAGKRIDQLSKVGLCLFNQKDIEYKIEKEMIEEIEEER